MKAFPLFVGAVLLSAFSLPAHASFEPLVCPQLNDYSSGILVPPIRSDEESTTFRLNLSNLGFKRVADGSWKCVKYSDFDRGAEYTNMKASYDSQTGVITATSFFEKGDVRYRDGYWTLEFFEAMASRYSDLPKSEHMAFRLHVAKVLEMIRDGELQPDGDVQVVDEPTGMTLTYSKVGGDTQISLKIKRK